MQIEWKPVAEYDGYFVSNTGIIRSFKRKKPHDLRYVTKDDGYLRVYLCKNGILIATFDSTCDAARKTGIWQQSISRAARGKLYQTGGYQWKYIKG